MSDEVTRQDEDHIIPHQNLVEQVIDQRITSNAGSPAAAIDDAEVEHALNSTFSDTEVEGALDALGGTVNSILAVLRAKGLVAEAEEE